ncbi:MAG: hypothetical protein E7267_05330 [Lachnospiraceae bacterium]|nr:hypothetical protein [Lachnospiraceae bacterium]
MKKTIKRIIGITLSLALAVPAFVGGKPAEVKAADDFVPVMTVDMTNELGELLHGSSGFLYGISSEDVPTMNLITPLKPKVLATKGALGTEHPYADALDVAETFLESGGEMVQMYNSNFYAIFQPKQFYQDYVVQLKEVIVPYVTEWKNKWKEEHNHNPETGLDDLGINIDKALVYLPINEGDSSRSKVAGEDFRQVFEAYYKAIKEVDPLATVGGMNPAEYSWTHVPPQWQWDGWHTWLSHLYNNDALPDVVTWHQLERNENRYKADIEEFEHYRNIFAGDGNENVPYGRVNNVDVNKIPVDAPPVVINEIAQSDECGVPGALVNWIGRFEDAQAYGCLPFWHQADNLNDLAADANEPNSAWWLYKWYADMAGQRLAITTNDVYSGLYGVASIDEEAKKATTLFGLGSEDGDLEVVLDKLGDTNLFKDADKVHVKIDATYFKGFNSACEPETIIEGTYELEDGDLYIDIKDALRSTGYRLTVTPADENDEVGDIQTGPFHGIYEAEQANRVGDGNLGVVTSGKYYLSGPRVSQWTADENRIGGSGLVNFSNNRGIEYVIDVPEDGKYKLEFVYGNQIGMNRGNETQHKPINEVQMLTIDGEESEMILKNTMEREWTALYSREVDWKAGKHSVIIKGRTSVTEPNILHDALHVTAVGAYEEELPEYNEVFEAEDGDFAFNALYPGVNPVKIEDKTAGFTGKGYITGLNEKSVKDGGGVRFNVIVEESGIYNMNLRYQSDAAGKATIYIGNAARTFNGNAKELKVVNSQGTWTSVGVGMYLQKGVNIVDIDATANILFDNLSVKKAVDGYVHAQEIEAVDTIPEGADMTGIEYDVWSVRWNPSYVDTVYAGLLNGAEPFTTTNKVDKIADTLITPDGEPISYVVGRSLTGDENAENDVNKYLEFEVDVPAAGRYAMQLFHSNDEIFGTHGYNTKIIDKFANIKVNDQEAKRYFFINTISRDTFKEKTVYVDLNKGKNTIKIFNDNSWKVMKGLDDGQARAAGLPDWREADPQENPNGYYSSYYFDKPGNIPIVNSLPNFSKFVITPIAIDEVIDVTGMTLNTNQLSLVAKGAPGVLTVNFQPVNATNTNVTWTSSSPSVATVSNGVVTPLAAGQTIITAVSESNPAIKCECVVTVTGTGDKAASFKVKKMSYKVLDTDAAGKTGTVEIIATAANKSLKKVTIPNTITKDGVTYKVVKIAKNAFKNSKKLRSVKIGNNVQEIGNSAFRGCKNLSKVTTGKALKKIGKFAFAGDKKLKNINFSNSKKLKSVGSKAFKGINAKAKVKAPKGKLKTYKKMIRK